MADDQTPDTKPAPTDEVSAALDNPTEVDTPTQGDAPADAPTAPLDAITASVREESQAKEPGDELPGGLDAAVATEAEGKPEEEVAPPEEPSAAATPGEASGDPNEEAAKSIDAVTEKAEEAASKPEETAPEAKRPSFGDVKGEVADLGDHLSEDTLDTLRDAGCGLFLFLTEMAECDVSSLSQEGQARIGNVRDKTSLLLSAIESVFVRHG